jgi:hypothetical protein
MLKYNNTHIFTGYLKQLLSSFKLPACKVYTHEFARYLEQHGAEDPRVLKSSERTRVNYLKNNELYNYFVTGDRGHWKRCNGVYYDNESKDSRITRTLHSPGNIYDTKTHEYLGDYLRFLRDYYNVNLMSLYNCFSDKVYNNIINFEIKEKIEEGGKVIEKVIATFNSQDSGYRIYAIPVKLFAEYTIALDSDFGIELFCGFYNTELSVPDDIAKRTYQKVNKTLFSQPFIYNKLNINNWYEDSELLEECWDLTNREHDLRLFIKVPAACESTITILEGDYTTYNNSRYFPTKETISVTGTGSVADREESRTIWRYQQNHSVLNFSTGIDLNNYDFKPIGKLQLLALNTRESYPFADRLIEYLSGSTIDPTDEIPDNIKRVQRVMRDNGYYFKIEGLWENKMQNILYDYMIKSGPHNKPGRVSKSTQYDVLGYVDKDTEKLYASWKELDGKAKKVKSSLQNVDIYNGLYDI